MAIYQDYFKLGRYMDPSIYIGPTVAAKTMKENGQVLYRSKYI